MSRTVQIVVLCLTIINGIRQNEAKTVCCELTEPPAPAATCQAPITTTTAAPYECVYRTTSTTTEAPCSRGHQTTTTTTQAPFASPQPAATPQANQPTPAARNPNPPPATETSPNYLLVQSNPGAPNMGSMPWYPYPMFNNYFPTVENPKTGEKYYVVPNPYHRTNKYTQTLNIFSPDAIPLPTPVAPANEANTINNNSTSTEQPTGKS